MAISDGERAELRAITTAQRALFFIDLPDQIKHDTRGALVKRRSTILKKWRDGKDATRHDLERAVASCQSKD